MRVGKALAGVLLLAPAALLAQSALDFEPRVAVIGARVTVKSSVPAGGELRYAGHPVPFLRESVSAVSFVVPPGTTSGFVEIESAGKIVARSVVPFVVSGPSAVPRLVGLKEAIDVFGYAEPIPEGGQKPASASRAILRIGDSDILTIGELPLGSVLLPAVELGDLSSAAGRGMGPTAFTLTARPPKKK